NGSQRSRQRPAAIGVDADADSASHGIANGFNSGQVGAGLDSHFDLDRLKTFTCRPGCDLRGARRLKPGNRPLGRNLLPHRTAEQPINRKPHGFAEDVPQGHFQGCLGEIIPRDSTIELCRQSFNLGRLLSDQNGGENGLNEVLRGEMIFSTPSWSAGDLAETDDAGWTRQRTQSSELGDSNPPPLRLLRLNRIAQRPSETAVADLHHVAILQPHSVAKAEGIHAEEVHVQVPRLAMRGMLEVVVLKIGEAVTHGLFTTADVTMPQKLAVALDIDFAGNGAKIGIDDQFRADGAGHELGSGDIHEVLFFKNMIGELVARGHANAPRRAFGVDDVNARNLRFFAAVVGVRRNRQWLSMRSQDGAGALVEPFGRDADLPVRRLAMLHAPVIDAHAVGRRGRFPVHRLTVLRAFQMRESGAAHQAARRFGGMIDRRQNAPLAPALIEVVVGHRRFGGKMPDHARQSFARRKRLLRQAVNGIDVPEKQHPFLVDDAYATLSRGVRKLHQSDHRSQSPRLPSSRRSLRTRKLQGARRVWFKDVFYYENIISIQYTKETRGSKPPWRANLARFFTTLRTEPQAICRDLRAGHGAARLTPCARPAPRREPSRSEANAI